MMLRKLCLILVCFWVAGCAGLRPGAQVADPSELVVLVAPSDAPALVAAAQARGYVLRDRDTLSALGEAMITLTIPPGMAPQTAIDEIEALAPGSTAGVNHLFRLQQASARTYADAMIRWPQGGCRAAVPVGLVDSIVDDSDPALDGVRITRRSFAAEPAGGDHGTLMAGLLVGNTRLSGLKLYAADVIEARQGGGRATGVASIVRAVDWLQGQGVKVVNLSLAGPYNKILDRGLAAAADQGMILVASAGNGGPDAAEAYPAKLPFVLAVTAVDAEGDVHPRAVNGTHIDVAAPGVDVFVPLGNAPRYASGTSVAAPFVTAYVARDPQLVAGGLDAVRARLQSTAEDLGPVGPDTVFGWGLLDAGPGCRVSG